TTAGGTASAATAGTRARRRRAGATAATRATCAACTGGTCSARHDEAARKERARVDAARKPRGEPCRQTARKTCGDASRNARHRVVVMVLRWLVVCADSVRHED